MSEVKTVAEELREIAEAPQRRYEANVKVLESLRSSGHEVEVKSAEVVYVDKRYMVYLYNNRYHDLKINQRGEFEDLATVIEDL